MESYSIRLCVCTRFVHYKEIGNPLYREFSHEALEKLNNTNKAAHKLLSGFSNHRHK